MGSGCLGSDPGLISFCSVSPLAAWLTIQSLSVPICQTRVALKTYVMRLMMLKGHTCKLEESLDLLLEPRWPLMCAKLLQWCPILCEPMDCSPPGFSVREDSPGKNTGVGCHVLLQGIFLTQGSNSSLLHLLRWQAGPLPLGSLGKPLYWPLTKPQTHPACSYL